MEPEVTPRIFDDPRALAVGAAELIAAALTEAIVHRGLASLVLSGGSTPMAAYRALAELPVDWKAVHIFWGDERCVPPSDPASNYRMARETLLEPAGIPRRNVHRMDGEKIAAEAASAYEQLLRERFDGPLPRFDFVLLGVGADGHVASLFPGSEGAARDGRWVVAVERPASEPDRVSLDVGPLSAARTLCLLVSGSGKAPIVRRILSTAPERLPAVAVVERAESVTWLLDRAAAGSLV